MLGYLWFLAYLAILLGLGTTSTAVAYVAVTQYAVLERLVSAVLRRGLRGFTLEDVAQNGPAYSVTRIQRGVQVEQLHFAKSILDKLGMFFIEVEAASVDQLQITFPSWSAPFRLRVKGLRFMVRQRSMPQHVEAVALAQQEQSATSSLKDAKLQAIDRLLWGTKTQKSMPASYPDGSYSSRLRARILHRTMAFCVDYIEVDAEDTSCIYMQAHEPGPLPDPQSHLEGEDTAEISIRRLFVAPQQKRPAIHTHLTEHEEIPIDLTAEKELDPGQAGFLQMFRIPGVVWRHLTLNERRATRAVISGVNISLSAYGLRQKPRAGDNQTDPVPVSATSPAPIPPYAFTAGTRSSRAESSSRLSVRDRLGSQEGAPPSSVRRKRLRNGSEHPSQVLESSLLAAAAAPCRKQPPAETHIILRQWGAEVTVAALPPLYSPEMQSRKVKQSSIVRVPRQTSLSSSSNKQRHVPVPSPFASEENIPPLDVRPNGAATHLNGPTNAGSRGEGADRPVEKSLAGVESWKLASAASLANSEEAAAAFVCTVDVSISLRAIVPHLTPQSVAVAFRMLDRAQEYSQYASYWQTRPAVPVSRSPSLWWQHAGSAAARECKLISRRQVPLRAIAARRANRLQYQELYARTHSRLSSFKEPKNHWWQRRKIPRGGSEEVAMLASLEEQLALEEIAHFRAGVAAIHSSALLDNPDHLSHALDAVDAVVGNLGPLPAPFAAMLFQNEVQVGPAPALVLQAAASCPRLGVLLTIEGDRNPLTAPLPDQMFTCLEALVTNVSCELSKAGEVQLTIDSIALSGQQSMSHAAKEPLLKSPSAAANRMLQVADLHGVVSKARGFTAELKTGTNKFLSARLVSHPGQWQESKPICSLKKGERASTAQVNPPYAAVASSPEAMEIRPPGMRIEMELAGIEVDYNKYIVLAALDFCKHLAALKGLPLRDQAPWPSRPLPELKADPGQPATLSERVFHAFAQQNMPVYKPLSLPVTRIKLSCPGLAARVPYNHSTAIGCQEPFDAVSQHHELIAAVTRIKAELGGEDFKEFMRDGATQHSTVHAYLDLFCYQPPAYRRRGGGNLAGTRATAFGNRTISGQRREHGNGDTEENSEDADPGDGVEMAAMAKVWAHPEDLHKYPLSGQSTMRSTRGSFSGAPWSSSRGGTGRSRHIPAYPMIPLLKVSGLQAETAQKVLSLPAAPGSLSVNTAASLHGIMVWVSPWQVAHLLSIIETIKRDLPPSLPTATSAEPTSVAQKAGTSAMRTQLRVQASLEIPLISAICSVARNSAELEAAIQRPRHPAKSQWKFHIPESDPAFLWAQCLAPTYGINIMGSRAALCFRGTGHLRGGLTIDGLLIRDLQLQPKSKFAFFLRPLPARAEELTLHATKFRTKMLRVVTTTAARRRWYWAVRKLILRRRSSMPASQMEWHMVVRKAALPFTSFVGLKTTGPQLVACCYLPPAQKYPGHPEYKPAPPARLEIQVGQLLLYARVSSNNRMLPFCSQIIDMVMGMSAPITPTREPKHPQQPLQTKTRDDRIQKQSGAAFAGLSLNLGIIGVDLKVVVQGKELVSLQLLDANMNLEMAPDPPPSQEGNAIGLELRIIDISIRDLQAIPEHSMVLRPNKRAEHCSLALDYTTPINTERPPLLVIEFANARILALFRFVYDILHGIEIINLAFAKHGGIFPPAKVSGDQAPVQPAAPAPEILIHLTNAGVVLPASSKSLKVLVADVDYVMLGMPGSSLSDTALNAAGLPSVKGMLRQSKKAARLFKPSPESAGCAPPTPFEAAEAQGSATREIRRSTQSLPVEAEHEQPDQAKQPHEEADRRLKDELLSGWKKLKRQTGVLFLNQDPAHALPQASAAGVLKLNVNDSQSQETVVPATPTTAAHVHVADAAMRDGGLSASTSGRQHQGKAPYGTPQSQGVGLDSKPRASAPAVPMQGKVDVLRGLEAPLPGGPPPQDNDDGDLPGPQIAIFAEGLVVSRASLKSLLEHQPQERSFCPKSVYHFAWPVLDFITVDRAPFIQPSSYSIVLHETKCPQTMAGMYQHLHLAADPVVVIMNAPNYTALLGFAQGNLLEISSYETGKGHREQQAPQRTKFNPAFQFGPPKDDMPTFRMTASLPLITTVFEADPRHWQSGAIRSRLGDPGGIARLPFMRVRVQNVEMDLGVLEQSEATYMQFNAGGATCDDLRLAYSKIMTEYEVYSEDSFEEMPQELTHTHAMFPGDKDDFHPQAGSKPHDIAAAAAAEFRMQQPPSAADRHPPERRLSTGDPASRSKRERSGDVLRQKSMQMHRDQVQQLKARVNEPPSWLGQESLQANPQVAQPAAGTAPIPVLSMELVSSLEAYFPAGSPVVHLLKAPAALPPSEAAHLCSKGQCQEGSEVIGATIALMKDGTVAVEVDLSTALIQWPFLSDISLAWAAASIFDPVTAESGSDPAVAAASNAADSILKNAELAPWLYFNAILRDSQLFLPVADPETLLDGVNFYFGGGAAAMNLHERLADLLLMQLSFSMEDPEYALRVEERGVSITWSALRVAYAMGGDGESDVKADLRHFAAFVRDPMAIVTCLLLPFSCSLHLEMQAPQAQERERAKRQQRAVVTIQRAWRQRRWQRAAERTTASRKTKSGDSQAGPSVKWPPVLLGVGDAAKHAALEAGLKVPVPASRMSQHQTNSSLMEQLIQEVATPRTAAILKDYHEQSKAMGGLYQLQRDPASIRMRVKLGDCTVRAAFSHVPFIQSIIWITRTMVLQPSPGNLTADSNLTRTLSAMEKEAAARDFRPSSFHMDGNMQGISLVLCNDKPQTFGAPDVLRLSVDQLSLTYVMDRHFHDRPPDQVAETTMHLYAQFLNNSSSRWEAICENWQLQAELVDTVSPIYRSDFQRHMWLSSKQHLSLNFNPSALLSFGDLLAFVNAVNGPMPNYEAIAGHMGVGAARLAAPEAAPEMQEQMAQRGSITSRVPQKYLIQNQSGLRVYYWIDPEVALKSRPVRTNSLDSGVSETLKVTPRRKVLQHITPGRGGIGKLQNVINLHFEGNWMPIKDVAVSVVGKYRYHMYSPAEHDSAPVVVDIILVGRTKIITLHSGIWLENCMDRKVSFRLHVPITPLVAPGSWVDERQRHSDSTIGPLKPGSGVYLPVTAVLGGILFVRPSGFREARRDVIRLSPAIADIEEQQGHITCEPLDAASGGPAIQAPLHCSLLVRPAQINSEFQAFKHIEMLAPGEFMRATESLEATLAIHPTLVLTNALPYVMEVIVWQVPPFRKLRQEKTRGRRANLSEHLYYDLQQMRTAFTGTVPIIGEANPYAAEMDEAEAEAGEKEHASSDRPDLGKGSPRQGRVSPRLGKPSVQQGRRSRSLGALSINPTSAGQSSHPQDLSFESSEDDEDENDVQRQLRRQGRQQFQRNNRSSSRLAGEHISITLAPGVSQNVYADMGGNVLVHVAIPALGMVATHWAVVSWSKDQLTRESVFDAKYIYRLPKEVKLRNLDSSLGMKSKQTGVASIAEYISKLKSAGQKFREAAHRTRKQKVEYEADDNKPPQPGHAKYPSEGTPLGPSVPTAMPSQDGGVRVGGAETPRSSQEEPSDPKWFNALYGSKTPSPESDGSEKPVAFVNQRASNVTLRAAPGNQDLHEKAGTSGGGLVGSSGSGFRDHSRRIVAASNATHTTTTFEAAPEPADTPDFGVQPSRPIPPPSIFANDLSREPSSEAAATVGSKSLEMGKPSQMLERPKPLSPVRIPSKSPMLGKGPARAAQAASLEIQPAEGLTDSADSEAATRGTVSERELSAVPSGRTEMSLRDIYGVADGAQDSEVTPGVSKAKDLTSFGYMRAAFDAWREYTVRRVTGHTGLMRQSMESGVQAPELLLLNIQNSLAESQEGGDNPICLLSFFSPYWVDNRTNMDLILQDHASTAPILLGYKTPLGYAEVLATAVGLIEAETPGGTHRSFWDIDNHQEIEVRPALLNKQETTRFCLADVAKKQYSSAIHINTAGLKGSMRVKGMLPNQGVQIAKAVQDGMARVFKTAASGAPGRATTSHHAPSESEGSVGDVADFAACNLADRPPTFEERIKVSIVPLVTVNIEELVARDSGEDAGQAAVFIRPRRPTSQQKLVSLVLDVVVQQVTPETSLKRARRQSVEEGINLDAIILDQHDENDSHHGGRLESKLKEGKETLQHAVHLQRQRGPTAHQVGQREYEFVAEVTSAPPNSVFRHTKVLTIKPRFVVDNQTGMDIEVKQRGTPDLEVDPNYGGQGRCSCRLGVNQRAAFHWDNVELEKSLVVRPLGDAKHGGECEWQWSGGFHLSTREEYFGLRIRHKTVHSRAINIPVNSTVGPSGCVLVTFKSRFSVPPYRIENKTSDVVVYYAQSSLKSTREKWNWLAPMPGGSAMAYAWDEPTADHRLQVQAHVQNRLGRPFSAVYELDKLGNKTPLNLPSATKTFSSSSTLERVRTLQKDMTNVPDSLKERVASVLASEFSKKVYVTVFADGPTRVLRFSDEPSAVTIETEQSILDLAARLKQVEADLSAVDGKFLQLHGPAGGAELDLYGRAASLQHLVKPESDVSRASSYKEARTTSQTGRIRLRQRGLLSVEGSPLALPHHESTRSTDTENGGEGRRGTLQFVHPSRKGRMGDSSSIDKRGRQDSSGKEQPAASNLDVIRPHDLGHHLANLHVPASSQAVQGSELMRSATAADSALLLGGDLLVTVWQAEGLQGSERVTHPFSRVRVGEQSQLTSVQWQSLNPRWDEALSFRDVSAAAELLLELWDVGGTRGAKQLQKLSQNPSKVIENAQFLGSVEIPLTTTMAMNRGTKHWFPLMRRSAADNVSGSIKLSFAWDVTARSLLNLKLAALERVLAQRTEVLCMLNPTSADTVLRWAQEDAQQNQLPVPSPKDKPEDVERSDPSNSRAEERSLAEQLLAKHMHEEHHSTLNVSVIEARGLGPRKGVVVAFQANQLPNPVVEISVPGHPSHKVTASHTVNPRWETAEAASYKRLSSDSRVTVRIYDRKGRNHLSLLGENTISCSRLTGDKPMYMWLPLLPSVKSRSLGGLKKRREMPIMEADVRQTPELQVHLRLQWVRQVVRGQYMNAELSLAGLGLIVMGGLQDELFNLTVDRVQVSAERTHLEARFTGSVKRIQLDNQMLDATQPVVLAPASVAHAHSKTAQALTGADSALIEFGIARSFAYSVLRGGEQARELAPAGNREHGLVSPMAQELQEGEKLGEGSSSIMSFKEIWITIGELDFQADDGFLEAILSFVVSIPMADVWQDSAWREQQRRLLTAQFGPKEVESLSMNAVLPMSVAAPGTGAPLEWMQTKELHELQVLRDQSSYSSWYFIERAYIGEINANVTIALTSSVLSGRQAGVPVENTSGLFSRFIGASGFQLINVNNVPLSLGSWDMDTKLLGRKAMINSLARHYFAQGIAEAHKVLGGAGPAIAAVPLTVVWVGGSFVTLLTGIGAGKVGPVGAAQRVGYVFFMSVAQVVSSLSRIGLSLMTFAPPNRSGHFSDSRALTRAVQRPANAFEAFGRCWEELFDSFVAALLGILLDPTQGYHTGGLPLALTGLAKGVVGIAVRPAVGILELVSKGTHGMGLVCLGREAITGSAQRRVRAPGALAEEQTEAVEDSRVPEMQAQQRNIVAAWQSSLSHMFPKMQEDVVVEVINTHAARTLLLCKGHVALVRSKSLALRSNYKSMWAVSIPEIKIVRGEDEKLLINLEYARKYDAKCFGVWTIPKKKSIKCGSRDLLERIIIKINRHMSNTSAGIEQAFANRFDPFETADLSIYKSSYTCAPLGP